MAADTANAGKTLSSKETQSKAGSDLGTVHQGELPERDGLDLE